MSDNEIHEVTREELQKFKDDLKKDIVGTMRWYLGLILGLFIGFFGWLAIDHLDLKQKAAEFKMDYGHVINQLEQVHPDNLVFKNYAQKYSPYRGSSINEP